MALAAALVIRNPLGALGIIALFAAPLVPYVLASFPELWAHVPGLGWALGVLCAVRVMDACIELYMIAGYVAALTEPHKPSQD
jgi:hypothetical protein